VLVLVSHSTVPHFLCCGPVCKWKEANHGAAARRASVPTAGTKSKRCKHTAKAFGLVEKVEETLQDNREMIWRLLNVELSAKQPFNISQICHETLEKVSEDEGMSSNWEKPNTHRARNQILEYQLIGTRRLANTLLLTVSGTNEGLDPKPTTVSRQTLLLQAKTICGGHAEHRTSRSKKGYRLPGQCANNARTSRDAAMEHEPRVDSRQCPCCEVEQHRAEPPSAHPCRVCVCQWLLQHNGLKVRLARELNETSSTDQQHPEATARIEGMTFKTDARQRGQLRVNPRMETTVDPERNDAWTALTMAALTARMSNTPKHQRRWDEVRPSRGGRFTQGWQI
jgi:hypothetical protein